jgi:hypothetical protein
MPRMMPTELRALLTAERWDAMSAITASKLSEERSTALNYYQGDMSKTMPAPDGRSKAVSYDVADTIEGLMPQLMEVFAGGDEVVRFEPHGPQDVAAAEQETDYINHVFMQGNPGFLVLYTFIKDALLSKVGVVKVFWETNEERERETYLDQPPDVLAALAAAQDVEIIEHTEHVDPVSGLGLHDITIEATRTSEQAKVMAVTPDEWGISRHARTIAESPYCFHDVFKTESQLIEQGFDKEQIKKLPSYIVAHTIEEIARDTVNESTLRQGEDNLNTANRLIRVTEHYVKMDYEGNDDARLYRITTAGEEVEVLCRDGEPDVVEWDRIPFAAMTPVIVTHRFFGRSIADLVKDLQEIKTALLRGALDNLYLHNNPRVEVSEAHATEATLDDLLVSRPGGIVRTKQPGGINWQEVPDVTATVYPALQYFDATREWRTGVSRQGQGVDPNALQNQVATIANQMYNAAQGKLKLIARIFAETGIKDLFLLLHGVIRKNATQAATVRLRNQWVSVDPRDWKTRNDMTINVGLGTGTKAEQLAHLQLIVQAQTQAVMGGLPIVSMANLYNSAAELTKLAGHKDVDKFFMAPGTPPDPNNPAAQPIQKPPDPKAQQAQQQLQLEQAKAQTDAAHEQAKAQADMAIAQQKFEFEKQIKTMDMAIATEKHQHEMHLSTTKMLMDGAKPGPDGQPAPEHPMVAPMAALTEQLKVANAPKHIIRDASGKVVAMENVGNGQLGELLDHLRKINGPKRIVRDAHGKAVGIEPVVH